MDDAPAASFTPSKHQLQVALLNYTVTDTLLRHLSITEKQAEQPMSWGLMLRQKIKGD